MADLIVLDSLHSTQISLSSIMDGSGGLSARRQIMLDRVPEIGDSAVFKHKTLELIDLAYLTAKTGHEFAILRGKDTDILFHGDSTHCEIQETLAVMLKAHKLELVGHSHPGEDDPIPSSTDRATLKIIGQKKSFVISGRSGRIVEFGQSLFEDYML